MIQDFVSQHNWTNPQLVFEFATNRYDIWKSARSERVGRTVVTAMRGAVAAYDGDKR